MKSIYQKFAILSMTVLVSAGLSGTPGAVNGIGIPDTPMKYWTKQEFANWLNNQNLGLYKTTGAVDRREGVMDGNKIRTVFYNYGSVGRPNTEPSIEWPKESNQGYAYEFGPMIGAEVVDAYGDTVHIFSDALVDGGDRSPSGKTWGWQPLPQYLNTNSETPAMSNDPDSWPRTASVTNPFYNPNYTSDEDMFLWPGVDDSLGNISADLEAFWVMDDRDNDEFAYYPFLSDSSRRGIGVELSCRLMQFSASLAEDVIFYIIKIKNVSDKRLEKVVAGMFGDPHIGGAGDFADDMGDFDKTTNMVYSWDKENSGNDFSLGWDDLGWLGFKFLESPKDVNGSELGLTSMAAPVYATLDGSPSLDDVMWTQMQPGNFSNIAQEKDNVFLFGTGYFSLDPGESAQFSIAILMGKGKDDLDANGEIAQEIYDLNYKFTKAPSPPKLTAVADDGKVTLYWDRKSEDSFDDFFQTYDFEGYKVYRSTDKGQTWGNVITNSYGREVGYIPLAQFDRDDDSEGLFPYDKDGVHFYLGKNTGLTHEYTDDNLINGVTYYYAVTSYDSGYVSKGVLPVESGIFPGVNMVSVTPSVKVPGYVNASVADLQHDTGVSTGKIIFEVIDPALVNGHSYSVTFDDTTAASTLVSVKDIETGVYTVSAYDDLEGFPVIFDGLKASFYDEPVVTVIDSLTGWADGTGLPDLEISLYPSGGVRLDKDIEIRFADTVVDTDLVFKKQVKFTVWNTTDNEKMDFIYFDTNKNDTVDVTDKIIPATLVSGKIKGTWQVTLIATAGELREPAAGDVIRIGIAKPFSSGDVYTVNTSVAAADPLLGRTDFMENIAVVPNPYVVASSYEVPPTSVFTANRGERRLYFIHVPPKCTIRIYTSYGELIRTIDHDSDIFDGTASWDLLTSEGLDISYGIYVYHIDAGEYGEKVGRFAVIK